MNMILVQQKCRMRWKLLQRSICMPSVIEPEFLEMCRQPSVLANSAGEATLHQQGAKGHDFHKKLMQTMHSQLHMYLMIH